MILVASVTHSNTELPLYFDVPSIVCIEPPFNWFEMCLNEIWQYRELL